MERVACNPTEECKYYPDCYTDTHHDYFPKKRYKSGVDRQFRELPTNKGEVCRAWHDMFHAENKPPRKPSRQEMYQAISEVVVYISNGGDKGDEISG